MEKFVIFTIALIVALAVSALGAWLVMLLWNWLMVAIFALPKLSFWMSWGLCFLISLLFGAIKSE